MKPKPNKDILKKHTLLTLSLLSFHPLALGNLPEGTKGAEPIYPQNAPKREMRFELPQQSLSSGLLEFAVQAKIQVVLDFDLLRGMMSEPLNGKYSFEEALNQLLANTALSFTLDPKTMTLIIVPKKIEDGDGGEKDSTDGQLLIEEIIVTGVKFPYTYNTLTHSHMHGNLNRYDAVRFFNHFSNQLITDNSPVELFDVLKLASAITPADGIADSNDDFYIRGFQKQSLYIDRFRLGGELGSKLPISLLDGVEILKGPATLFYGQSEPGGVVDVKLARADRLNGGEFSMTRGQEGFDTAHVKLGKEFQDNFGIGLITGLEENTHFRDLLQVKRSAYAPSLHYDFNDDSKLEMNYLKLNSSFEHQQGSILLTPDGETLNLVSLEEQGKRKHTDVSAALDYFHLRFSQPTGEKWQWQINYHNLQESRQGVRGSLSSISESPVFIDRNDANPEQDTVLFFGEAVEFDRGTSINFQENQFLSVATLFSLYDEEGKTDSQFVNVSAETDFKFAGATNNLSFGLEQYQKNKYQNIFLEQRNDLKVLGLSPDGTTNALDPIETIYDENAEPGQIKSRAQLLTYTDTAAYIEDSIQINSHWGLSLGTRMTRTEGSLENFQDGTTNKLSTFNELSYQIGVVYRSAKSRSFYVTYSEGMRPNYIVGDFSASVKAPETSYQFELGASWMALKGDLLGSAAIYRIEKNNIANIEYDFGVRSINTDAIQEVYGIDADMTYQLNTINLISSVSILNATLIAGEYRGLEPPMVASFTWSAFANYSPTPLKGLSFNLGAYVVGDRFADSENSVVLAGFETLDLGAAYEFQWAGINQTIQLTIKNALANDYLSSLSGGVRATKGESRRVFLSTSSKF